MSFDVQLSPEAVDDLAALRAYDRAAVLDALERILAVNPTVESKSRIKRLQQPAPTAFRMRVDDVRVYYDVEDDVVWVTRILSKEDSLDYLPKSS
jgi:mRNA-degrading endonuclease RelE of RelBE toxin-antitoxin system